MNFGPVAGVNALDMIGRWQTKRRPYAIAMTAGGTGAGLICIRDDGVGLKVQGADSHLTVNNLTGNYNDGAIQVNSTGDAGMSIISTPVIEAWEINMCASTHSETADFTFPDVNLVNYKMPPIPDPLLGLPAPTWDPVSDQSPSPGKTIVVSEGETRTFSPGYYSGGFRFTGGTSILQPGIYILDGRSTGQKAGLVTIGGANIDATSGVMFYITGDGVVDIGGNGIVRADPMTSGVYEHMTIFVDRDSDNSSIIHGTTGLDLNGTLYFPHVPSPTEGPNQAFSLEIDGTGEGFGNQLIADSIHIPGQADVVINYDGRNPAPVTKAFLVE